MLWHFMALFPSLLTFLTYENANLMSLKWQEMVGLAIFTQKCGLRKEWPSVQLLSFIKDLSKVPPTLSWKTNVLQSFPAHWQFSHGAQSNINWLHRFLLMNHEQVWIDLWQQQRERYYDCDVELTFASASSIPSVVCVWSLCIPCWEAVSVPYWWQSLAEYAWSYSAAPAEGARNCGHSTWSLNTHKRRIILHSEEVPCAIPEGKCDSYFSGTWAECLWSRSFSGACGQNIQESQKGFQYAPVWLLPSAAQCRVYGLSGRKPLWCSADRPFPSLWLHCGPVPGSACCLLLECIAMQPRFRSYPMPHSIVLRAQEYVFQHRSHELPTASEERAPCFVREFSMQSSLFPLWVTCHWNLTERGDCQGPSEPCVYLADEKWLCERLPQAHHAQHGIYWWDKLPSEKAPIPGVYLNGAFPCLPFLGEEGKELSIGMCWPQWACMVSSALSCSLLSPKSHSLEFVCPRILFWLTFLYTVFWGKRILGILSWGIQCNATSINCQKNHCVWDTSQRTGLCTMKSPFDWNSCPWFRH